MVRCSSAPDVVAIHSANEPQRKSMSSENRQPADCVPPATFCWDVVEEDATDQQVKKGRPYSITERRVLELIPILGSQPVGDVSHKLGGRLPLLSARPAVTPATLKRAAASFAA